MALCTTYELMHLTVLARSCISVNRILKLVLTVENIKNIECFVDLGHTIFLPLSQKK